MLRDQEIKILLRNLSRDSMRNSELRNSEIKWSELDKVSVSSVRL